MVADIIIAISGVYLILLGMMMSTKGLLSLFLFKGLPFFIGLANLLIAAESLGWFAYIPRG